MEVKSLKVHSAVKRNLEKSDSYKNIKIKSKQRKGLKSNGKTKMPKLKSVLLLHEEINFQNLMQEKLCSDVILMPDGYNKIPKELEEPYVDTINEQKNQFTVVCNGIQPLKKHSNATCKKTKEKSKTDGRKRKESSPILQECPISTKNSEKFLEVIRKWNLHYEQQTLLLREEISKVEKCIEKVKEANGDIDKEFKLVTIFTQQIENKLVDAFANFSIPNYPCGATSNNISQYMLSLYSLHTSKDGDLIARVREKIQSLDMTVNLGDFV